LKKNELTFEEGIEKLEQLVSELESGKMPLKESFKAFEECVKLKKRLSALLDEGDARIKLLTQTGEQDAPEELQV